MNRLRVGDLVAVISGDDKGKQGRIKRILRSRSAVIVEGVNVCKKAVKPTQTQQGGIITFEAPINASKVMPVDPVSGKPTRVRHEVREGKKIRVAKSGQEIVATRQADGS